jgi:biopolymer transport protein ExbD
MLAYTAGVVCRHSYRSHLALRKFLFPSGNRTKACLPRLADEVITIAPEFARSPRQLAAELRMSIGNLKAISSAAPFLGLTGTCCGIMTLFRGYDMEKHELVALLSSEAAAAIFPAAIGILVAIPAVCSHNYLHRKIELLKIATYVDEASVTPRSSCTIPGSHKFPLAKRFSGLPSFPLIAAPSLAFAVAILMTFASHNPLGFSVRLSQPVNPATIAHSRPQSIIIGVVRNSDDSITAYMNSKEMILSRLEASLREKININQNWTAYLQAEDDVSWADVANVIDILKQLHADVVLTTRRGGSP